MTMVLGPYRMDVFGSIVKSTGQNRQNRIVISFVIVHTRCFIKGKFCLVRKWPIYQIFIWAKVLPNSLCHIFIFVGTTFFNFTTYKLNHHNQIYCEHVKTLITYLCPVIDCKSTRNTLLMKLLAHSYVVILPYIMEERIPAIFRYSIQNWAGSRIILQD